MYVDCFVTPVKKINLKKYQAHARKWAKVWLKCGALTVTECAADDVKPGKVTSFPQSVKCKPDELVVVSWITFPSKKVRDASMKKAMKDPTMAKEMMDPSSWPFDGKRMFYGGFKPLVNVAG